MLFYYLYGTESPIVYYFDDKEAAIFYITFMTPIHPFCFVTLITQRRPFCFITLLTKRRPFCFITLLTKRRLFCLLSCWQRGGHFFYYLDDTESAVSSARGLAKVNTASHSTFKIKIPINASREGWWLTQIGCILWELNKKLPIPLFCKENLQKKLLN